MAERISGGDDAKRGLMLTRRVDEGVVINVDGREMVITVREAAGGRARLRFEAGLDFKITRSELRPGWGYEPLAAG